MLSIKETIVLKIKWEWKKKPTTSTENEPKQNRFSKASDTVLGVAGKVTLLLILVAASVSSIEKTKNSYKNM